MLWPTVLLSFLAALPTALAAADAPADTRKPESKSEWVFSLLPKSLQRNPRLELTVITEMTEAGRRARQPSAQQPAYVDFFTTGAKHLGHTAGNERTLRPAEVEALLERALAANGFVRAAPQQRKPDLMILYTWGTHALLVEPDADNPMLSGNEVARNLLDRAAMVGGAKFAGEMLQLFEQADALAIADQRDAERKAGKVRGPLHGIPILIKDNIDSADRMKTSAGSLALAASTPPRDAFIVAKLREAGAVLLGKTNLSEWANYRSTHATSGWSGRGGQTKNAYVLDRNPGGSSAGTGAAIAAGFAAIGIGIFTGPQKVSWPELRDLWLHADAAGYDSAFTWDHIVALHGDLDREFKSLMEGN